MLNKLFFISTILVLYIIISSGATNEAIATNINCSTNRTDQPTPLQTLKETAISNKMINTTNNVSQQYITTFDLENSLRRALFSDTKLNHMKLTYNETNYIYFYQWKNMFAYYITLPYPISYADFLGLNFNIQEFIRTMLLSYNIEDLKSIYVKEFLTLTLASGLLVLRHVIIDNYEILPPLTHKIIQEIESVKKICIDLDIRGVDYHTPFNDYVLDMLVKVKDYYKKEGSLYYPAFKVWTTSSEEIEKYHRDIVNIENKTNR